MDLVRRAVEAFNADDYEGFVATLGDEVEIVPLRGQLEGLTYSGPEAARDFWAAKEEAWEDIRSDVEEIGEVPGGALLIGTLRGRGRESGADVAVRSGWTFAFAGDRISAIRMHPSVEAAREAAGAD